MEQRPRIKSKLGKILYLPFAIVEWSFYTIVFSGLGLFSLTPAGLLATIVYLARLDTESAKEALEWTLMPIVLPVKWWIDYLKKGEIGIYN